MDILNQRRSRTSIGEDERGVSMIDSIIETILKVLKEEWGEDCVEVDTTEDKIYVSDEDSSNGCVISVEYMT